MSEIQGIAPPDTQPEKAVPLPIAVPAVPSPPSLPTPETLRSWLPLYLSKGDRTIEHLNKILSSPSGTDTLLLTLCYTSLLTSNLLSRISLARLHSSIRILIEKAISLPPNTTVLITASSIPPSRLLITSQRLKALSKLISDFRNFARLWGLLGIWKWGKGLIEDPPADKTIRRIKYAQVFVNVFYQYLENGAYLSSKGIMGWSGEKQSKAWAWSSRFWMMHVGLDFWRLYHEHMVRKGEIKDKDGVREEGEREWRRKWKKELVVDLAYAPLTVHWSLEEGLVSEFWVGLLGSVAGVTTSRFLWRNTGLIA